MDFQTIKPHLLALETPLLCDADPSTSVIDPQIIPMTKNQKMVGLALTVQSNNEVMTTLDGLNAANRDHVLVISCDQTNLALAGEIFANEAKRIGLAGIIIDGSCRDVDGIRETDIPFYARGINPKATHNTAKGTIQVPVICGGVTIHPNDIIFGDQNGIVVIHNHQSLDTLLPKAQAIQESENLILEKLKNGAPLATLLTKHE